MPVKIGRKKKNADFNIWNDIEIRAALGMWFIVVGLILWSRGFPLMRTINEGQFRLAQAIDMATLLVAGAFSFLVSFVYAVRLPPVNKIAGVAPAITANVGAWLMLGFVFLKPRAGLSPDAKILAGVLILTGYTFAILALGYLGRSFSILPEGRRLVTRGPYRFIRHPMYLAEVIIILGVGIDFLSMGAVAIVAVQLFMQFRRMHYEEQVMREAFPEYEKYSRRTARLLPGIY